MTKTAIPNLTDESAAQRFVADASLCDYDLAELVPAQVVVGPPVTRIRLELPVVLVEKLRAAAKSRRTSLTAYVRQVLERKHGDSAG